MVLKSHLRQRHTVRIPFSTSFTPPQSANFTNTFFKLFLLRVDLSAEGREVILFKLRAYNINVMYTVYFLVVSVCNCTIGTELR
jgi:hypothetical protein